MFLRVKLNRVNKNIGYFEHLQDRYIHFQNENLSNFFARVAGVISRHSVEIHSNGDMTDSERNCSTINEGMY